MLVPDYYRERWDEHAGLWAQPAGGADASAKVHGMRNNAWMLVAAGLDGVIGDVPADRVLQRLRDAQAGQGDQRGCFWWKLEDGAVGDTNSAFFTTLALIVLRIEFGEQLADDDRAVLDIMLRESRHWFRSETEPLPMDRLRYPNRTLGDLTCRWLLMELFEEHNEPATERALADGLAYYRDSEWGWGEHLSDLYGKVCQGQVTALLAYAKRLPPETASLCEALFRELAVIDAAFAGGPRVPTIRCYAFDHSPTEKWAPIYGPYHDLMRPWSAERRVDSQMLMATIAHRYGLHERFTVPPRSEAKVAVSCHGGAHALATITDRWRIGAMTRYPIMRDVDHPGWGLHWQSMPAAFFHQAGDWGFLQWVVRAADGRSRTLPAECRSDLPSHVLSDTHPDAAVGHTFGHRVGDGFLVLRRMDAVDPDWTSLGDRFRLLHATCAAPIQARVGEWSRLDLAYGDHVLTLGYHALGGDAVPALSDADDGALHWEHRRERLDVTSPCGLWFLAMHGGQAVLPTLTPHGCSWRVRTGEDPKLTLDPHGESPWGTGGSE